MFRHLGITEMDFRSHDVFREAIKFFSNAPQHLLHVGLDGHFRQSPGVGRFRATMGWA
jgi:hypothetical protein